jgi:hypothetical protein
MAQLTALFIKYKINASKLHSTVLILSCAQKFTAKLQSSL